MACLVTQSNECPLAYRTLLSPLITRFLDERMGGSANGAAAETIKPLSCAEQDALHLWRNLQLLLVSNRSYKNALEASMDSVQRKSWRVLDDWWNGQHELETPRRDDATLLNAFRLSEFMPQGHGDPGNGMDYEIVLARLFVVEMTWFRQWELDHSYAPINLLVSERDSEEDCERRIEASITLARANALKLSVWKAIGKASYASLSSEQRHDRATRRHSPVSPTSNANQSQQPIIMSSTLSGSKWLSQSSLDSLRRKPYYLWDRYARETVETNLLGPGKLPRYYCISHTWGRWRQDGAMVSGIPWPVPKNAMFDVHALPQMFAELEWPVRYLWFDLFCIPQEGQPQQQAEEIGKQAEIFQQAENMIIWMHDVCGWDYVRKAAVWTGLNFLRCMGIKAGGLEEAAIVEVSNLMNQLDDELPGYVDIWNKQVGVELTSFGDRWEGHEDGDPASMWFSSLWTLQEAYLCPGALLADRSWKLLGIGQGSSAEILLTLDNLASLFSGPAGDVLSVDQRDIQKPSWVSALKRTLMKWQLIDLPLQNPGLLLLAAEARVATGSRVEAIMSALGCTKWFEAYRRESDGLAPTQRLDLVLGMYPVEFLREAHRKLGGVFWLYRRGHPETMRQVNAGIPVGSLLPLASSPRAWQFVRDEIDIVEDLFFGKLTEDWEIQSDGSVVVRSAVTVFETHGPGIERSGPFTIFSAGISRTFNDDIAWSSKADSYASVRVAAVVACDIDRCYGVVLEGKRCSEVEGRLILVRVAIFQTEGNWQWRTKNRDKEPVDWVVL